MSVKENSADANQSDYIQQVGLVFKELMQLGLHPTLVGGMALVVYGSQRVTKDFDLLVEESARDQKDFIHLFYRLGFELASKVNENGEIIRTVDNKNIAFSKLGIDAPKSIYFYNHAIGLRVDVLFDFPICANDIFQRADKMKINSKVFYVASRADLIAMKKIAFADRKEPKDQQDLMFLQKLKPE